ncbi:hypothetical protein VTO42DRAFT_1557 [Malbranchea cinnamomea]
MKAVKDALPGTGNRPFGRSKLTTNEEPLSGVRGAGTATDPYDAGNATDQPGNRLSGHSQESAARLTQDTTGQAPANTEAPLPEKSRSTTMSASSAGQTALDRPSDQKGDASRRGAPAGAQQPLQRPTEQLPSMLDQALNAPSSHNQDAIGQRGVTGQSRTLAHNEAKATAPEPPSSNPPPAVGPPSIYPGGIPEMSTSTSRSLNENKSKEPDIPQEKDYRSTGFAAEGGNFDAAASGAGKEAERLRMERGDVLAGAGDRARGPPPDQHGGLFTGSHKSGISMAKAKEKLHIGKHHA